MATANPQGIMALPTGGATADTGTSPDTGAPAQPQMGLDDSYDAVQQGLQNASPDAHSAVNAELAKIAPQLDQLTDEAIDQLLQIIQYMYDNPKDYAQALQDLIAQGVVEAGDLPEEHDPEFLSMFGMILMQAKKSRQGSQQSAPIQEAPVPPMGMARGGIAEAAHMVASRGRGQDTMLAHITPREAQMLRAKGGMGTINPATGLPEYGFFSSIGKALSGVGKAISGAVKGVASAVKSIVSSPIGKVLATVALATFLGPGAFGVAGLNLGATASMALASGAVTALGGGNINDVLKSAAIGGATAFFGAPGGAVSNFVGGAVSNAAANAAITSGIVGTGIGLLSGQKLEDAVKSGLTAGTISGLSTGVSKGFSATMPDGGPVDLNLSEQARAEVDAANKAGQAIELPPNEQITVDGPVDPAAPVTSPVKAPTSLADMQQNANAPSSTSMQNVGGTAPPEVFMHDGVPKYAIKDVNGNITGFKTVPFADRVHSANGTITAQPSSAVSYDQPGRFGVDSGVQNTTTSSAMNDASSGFQPSSSVANAPTTSLDQFLAQNDGSELPNGSAGPAGDGSYKPPTFERAYNEFGRGEYGNAAKTVFMPESPTPAQVVSTPEYKELIALRNSDGTPVYTGKEAIAQVSESMSPGLIRTYGPATAAGLGIAGLAGAFTPTPPEPDPEQEAMNARLQGERDRVAANPGAYVPQGMQRFGITYDDRGQITGGNAWSPEAVGPTEVAGNYLSYSSTPYSGYNFMPRYAANGGIMSNAMPVNSMPMNVSPSSPVMRDMGGIASLARGGYPRRTGPISGPGTGTSDSIPAMLSDGEFVMTAKAVRGAGKGSRLAGAKRMYALMHQLERNAARG